MWLKEMARRQVDRRTAGVLEGLGDASARSLRRDARVAGNALDADLREAAPFLTGTAAAALCAVYGANMVTFALADLLERRMQRSSARLTIGAAGLALGAWAFSRAWRRRPADPLRHLRGSIAGPDAPGALAGSSR